MKRERPGNRALDGGQRGSRAVLEDMARQRGVQLVHAPTPAATPAPAPKARGFMAGPMPNAAAMMAELKATLDPGVWRAAMDNLRSGGGYVIDLETNIAVGFPPREEWEEGRVQSRDGYRILRVRRRVAAS